MITIQNLVEWTLRSSILILGGALVLRALRVKDPSLRLAAWTAMLFGSLAIPFLALTLPKLPVTVMRVAPSEAGSVRIDSAVPVIHRAAPLQRIDWTRAALAVYWTVAATLLLRLAAGLLISRRLLHGSGTAFMSDGIEVRESDRVGAPVTLGILRPAIVLPVDWREWESAKLDAVLAHERSHIERHDPAVQLVSALHRALSWFSPLSWFLHRRIVRVSEEASDDAALTAVCDRASYAEILLHFMQRGMRRPHWHGVAMARYGRPDQRIHRILDETSLSRGITRSRMAAILAVTLPLAWVIALAQPQPRPETGKAGAAGVSSAPIGPAAPQSPAPVQKNAPRIRRYMIVSGNTIDGSWDSRDPVDEQGMAARFGRDFAWFRQGGYEYVVTDSGVLADLQQAMEPQKEVNRMQSAVNDLQNEVNEHQNEVNRVQEGVNEHQTQANRRQEIINELQSAGKDDELIKRMTAALAELQKAKGGSADQETVNREQARVNEMQARVNEEQAKVNQRQNVVNENQRRVSAEYSGRIDDILDSALRHHLADKVK